MVRLKAGTHLSVVHSYQHSVLIPTQCMNNTLACLQCKSTNTLSLPTQHSPVLSALVPTQAGGMGQSNVCHTPISGVPTAATAGTNINMRAVVRLPCDACTLFELIPCAACTF
eukprot:scaffold5380_cov37-Tisochrysis_lutea.AAC.1